MAGETYFYTNKKNKNMPFFQVSFVEVYKPSYADFFMKSYVTRLYLMFQSKPKLLYSYVNDNGARNQKNAQILSFLGKTWKITLLWVSTFNDAYIAE